ncbi:MAG: trypsin-like peptidase domain-containing protein [Deltaproteobacteria bacterium]|nr:trypsin-like peptidase domain-containing protein [Deltaproteobacteria bacterium]
MRGRPSAHPGTRVAATLVASVAVLTACGLGNPNGQPAPSDSPPPPPTTPSPPPTPTPVTPPPAPIPSPATPGHVPGLPGNPPGSFADLVRRVSPAVVNIATATVVREPAPFDPFHLGVPRERVSRSLGTGFLIDDRGTILTNNHVIANATAIRVQLADERELDARIVGRDPQTDVAVIRVEAQGTPRLPLGDSDALRIGDWVVAIGNPFGLAQTVTAGILSARDRTGDELPLDPSGYYSFLQTDASINPGNSGGPLLNTAGEVIGINTAVNRAGQGIGFAIPMAMVRQILPMLLRDGRVTRSWIGIGIAPVDEVLRERFRLPDRHGAVVANVVPGGPAALAGLRAGDVILAFDSRPIRSASELPWLASMAGVGHRASLRVQRDGRPTEVQVVLGQLPERTPARPRPVPQVVPWPP